MARLTGTELQARAVEARALRTLDTQIRVNRGAFMTRRQMIEGMIAEGATVVVRPSGERWLQRPDGVFFDERATTKTGMDYAASLTA